MVGYVGLKLIVFPPEGACPIFRRVLNRCDIFSYPVAFPCVPYIIAHTFCFSRLVDYSE